MKVTTGKNKKQMMMTALLIASVVAIATPVKLVLANPTISTFNDKTAFLTATGAASATGPLPNLGLIPGGAAGSQTVGSVTFSISPPSNNFLIGTLGQGGVTNNDWTLRLPGPDIAISDVENLNVDLAGLVFSLGFDFVKPQTDPNINAAFGDSVFTVTLKNGAVIVDSFTFGSPSTSSPTDAADFVGVSSDTAFNRVEIRETTGGIDNEFFGQVYTGTTPLSQAVGGEILPVDTASLFIAGAFTNAYWILPLLAGIAGTVIAFTRTSRRTVKQEES